MKNLTFYHAGCPVCQTAEQEIMELINSDKLTVINLSLDRSKIEQAKKEGIKSVPALLTPSGNVLHINYGASINEI